MFKKKQPAATNQPNTLPAHTNGGSLFASEIKAPVAHVDFGFGAEPSASTPAPLFETPTHSDFPAPSDDYLPTNPASQFTITDFPSPLPDTGFDAQFDDDYVTDTPPPPSGPVDHFTDFLKPQATPESTPSVTTGSFITEFSAEESAWTPEISPDTETPTIIPPPEAWPDTWAATPNTPEGDYVVSPSFGTAAAATTWDTALPDTSDLDGFTPIESDPLESPAPHDTLPMPSPDAGFEPLGWDIPDPEEPIQPDVAFDDDFSAPLSGISAADPLIKADTQTAELSVSEFSAVTLPLPIQPEALSIHPPTLEFTNEPSPDWQDSDDFQIFDTPTDTDAAAFGLINDDISYDLAVPLDLDAPMTPDFSLPPLPAPLSSTDDFQNDLAFPDPLPHELIGATVFDPLPSPDTVDHLSADLTNLTDFDAEPTFDLSNSDLFNAEVSPLASPDSTTDYWGQVAETQTVPLGPQASGQFLDTVTDTIYPNYEDISFDGADAAFEEAAQYLLPETAEQIPSDFAFDDATGHISTSPISTPSQFEYTPPVEEAPPHPTSPTPKTAEIPTFSAPSTVRQDAQPSSDLAPPVFEDTPDNDSELIILASHIIGPHHALFLVHHNNQHVLMAEIGPPENSQASILKTFAGNPLSINSDFYAVKEGSAGGKDIYILKVGHWQGVVGLNAKGFSLQTELR